MLFYGWRERLTASAQIAFCSDFSVFPDWKIKGSTLRSKSNFVGETFGASAGEQFFEWIVESAGRPILDADWYRFEVYDAVLHELARRHFGGNLERLQEVGRHSARHALSETYSIFAVRKDFVRFLEKLSVLHSRFYNLGRLVLTERGDDYSEHELRELPGLSEADAHLALGFYLGSAEVMGLAQARGRFEPRDAHSLFYRIDWS